jgi:hypothetical protein
MRGSGGVPTALAVKKDPERYGTSSGWEFVLVTCHNVYFHPACCGVMEGRSGGSRGQWKGR